MNVQTQQCEPGVREKCNKFEINRLGISNTSLSFTIFHGTDGCTHRCCLTQKTTNSSRAAPVTNVRLPVFFSPVSLADIYYETHEYHRLAFCNGTGFVTKWLAWILKVTSCVAHPNKKSSKMQIHLEIFQLTENFCDHKRPHQYLISYRDIMYNSGRPITTPPITIKPTSNFELYLSKADYQTFSIHFNFQLQTNTWWNHRPLNCYFSLVAQCHLTPETTTN